ncbi:MAG: FtsX-like permease family protein, partial [Bacteroidota bacterium]
LLLSYITFSDVFNEGGSTETSATWDGFYTYLLLRPHVDWKELESRFPETIEQAFDTEMRENLVFRLQALKDIHLDSHYLFESEANGDRLAVRLLSIIGMIILVIAWFNFINLSTARATHRAKEVGIRKVIGGNRKKLVSQFLLEAVMFNAIAIGISLLLIPLLQGPFEALVGKPISLSPFSYPTFYFISLLVLITGTLLSGLYPAFVLSSIRPIQALKSNVGQFSYRGGNWLRKSLLLVQYIASASLIACTLLIYFQLQYLQKTKLGINLDQVLIVEGPIVRDSTSFTKYQTFAQDVEEFAYVNNIVGSSSIPGQGFGWTIGTVRRVGGPEEITRSFHALVADEEYTRMYEMELAAGRHLMGDMGTEELSCILNETGVRKLEFASPQKAIGEKVELKNGNQLTIVGVLKDFYQESPKSAIEPLLLVKPWGQMIPQYFSIKLQTQNLPETLQKLETKWVNFFPQTPFQYFFLDDHFNKQYEADRRFAQAFTLFSGLTIFVSCLGIFALIAFTVERKRKEIGIRRILGASVGRIILLLSSDLFRLIGLALIISLPIAWYVMDKWLETFIHHISIQWWVFLIAGLLTLIITLFTSGFHSLKAAMTNPVESLRNE